MELTGQPAQTPRRELALAAIAGTIAFIAFTIWGGVPTDNRIGSFALIIGVMLVLTCLFAVATWHLLFRPLPAGHKRTEATLSVGTRQMLALLLAVGGLCLVVGPFWDEVWHRMYGIPFGKDLFWRPHLLMYFGFGSGALVAFWGLYHIMTHHEGTFQQRIRANPLVGLLIMSGAFLMYVVPADPVWHVIYGRDITAWSIPHLLLIITIGTVMLMAALVHLSTLPLRNPRGLHRIGAQDVLPLLMYAGIMMPWLQILVIDWDGMLTGRGVGNQFRPDWLMAGCVVFVAGFIGVLANRSLRMVGTASACGLIALFARYAMIQIFHVQTIMHHEAWLMAMLPLIAIDVWMAYRVFVAKRAVSWLETGIAGAAGFIIGLPVVNALYPGVMTGNYLPVVLAALVGGLAASWLATQIGDYAATQNKQIAETSRAVVPLMSMGAMASFVLFVLFFIGTAAPPVLGS